MQNPLSNSQKDLTKSRRYCVQHILTRNITHTYTYSHTRSQCCTYSHTISHILTHAHTQTWPIKISAILHQCRAEVGSTKMMWYSISSTVTLQNQIKMKNDGAKSLSCHYHHHCCACGEYAILLELSQLCCIT